MCAVNPEWLLSVVPSFRASPIRCSGVVRMTLICSRCSFHYWCHQYFYIPHKQCFCSQVFRFNNLLVLLLLNFKPNLTSSPATIASFYSSFRTELLNTQLRSQQFNSNYHKPRFPTDHKCIYLRAYMNIRLSITTPWRRTREIEEYSTHS